MGPGEKGGHVRISGDGSMLGTSSWVAALQPQHPGGPLWDRSGGRLLPMGSSPCSAVRLFCLPSALSGDRHSRMAALLAQSSRSLRL